MLRSNVQACKRQEGFSACNMSSNIIHLGELLLILTCHRVCDCCLPLAEIESLLDENFCLRDRFHHPCQ